MKRQHSHWVTARRWVTRASLVAAAIVVVSFLPGSAPQPAAFGGLSDEAIAVWQHRGAATTSDWDIWYSALGRPTPTGTLSWHAAGGPVPEAAPVAVLPGDDKNPHISTNAGVTMAVWQHAAGTGSLPGDWDIFFSAFSASTGLWTAPTPVATLTGDDYDPNVTVDSNGTALAVWVHRDAATGSREIFYSVRSGGSWSAAASVGTSGGKASLPEVNITSVASTGGAMAHTSAAAWSDVACTPSPTTLHCMYYSTFNGTTWTAPAEIESAATGISQAITFGDVVFADYTGTEPDPFGAYGRLGVTADASGAAYVIWGGGPVLLGVPSEGVVGAILSVSANTWSPMLTPFGSRFIGVGGCENPDDALTTGGGDFVGVFDFAGFIEHTFRTGGAFTVEALSYDTPFPANDQRPSDAAISATEMISVNWFTPDRRSIRAPTSSGRSVP